MSQIPLLCDEARYHQAQDVFNTYCNQRLVLMDWWKTKMPEIIAKTSSTEPYRVLAVGTGNGKPFDEELLNMLCTSQKHVVYTVVEPMETVLKQFQDLAKKYNSVDFRWFCMTWQDFQDKEWKKEDGSQYNLIHFVHSIYHANSSLDELKQRMKKCYAEILNTSGALVEIADNAKGKTFFFTTIECEGWWNHNFNIVHEIASKEGWKVEAEELKFQIDLSKCFDEESVEGNLLIDFLTYSHNFRQNASLEDFDKTLRHFEEQTEDESKIVYPCILEITTIWK